MNKKALSLAVCLAMALPTALNALSLGEIESNSSLNQPFRGTIRLLSTSIAEASSLRVRVASPAVFNRVGIDRPAFLNSIRFRTTVKNGRPVILVSSNQAINEPFLNFLLEVSWPNGQLLKEYTVLLDPPVLVQPDTAIASNAAGVRQEPGQRQVYRRQSVAQAPRRVIQQPRRVVRHVAPRPAQRINRQASKLRRPSAPRSASDSRIKNYRVKHGDTLYKVARKLGYKGIRNEQMMVALFNKNKRAFSHRNMNNLKAGVLLSRPSYQEAKSTNSRKARSKVVAQAKVWKHKRVDQTVVNNAPVSTNHKSVAPVVKQAHLEVMGGSNKSINPKATPGRSGSAAATELRKQLALTNEALTTRLKENEELKSRVSELESLLRKKNKLITMKSEQLALLQDKIGGGSQGIKKPAQVDPIITKSEEDGTGIQQAAATAKAIEEGTILRSNPDQLAISTDDPSIFEAETPEAKTDTDQDPFIKSDGDSVESDSLDIMGLLSSPAAMGAGGGTLLALLGGLWFMRRRKATDEYQDFGSIDIDDQMDGGVNFDNSSDISGLDSFDEPDFGGFDDEIKQEGKPTLTASASKDAATGNEQEDILQEADVYIVYGLYDQAESELKRAISADPTNLSYRSKLLENYKAAGNKEAFEDEAKEFMALNVEGKDKYLDNITEWGKVLLPGNSLFGGNDNEPESSKSGSSLKTAAVAAGAAGIAMVAGKALADNNETDLNSLDSIDLDNTKSDFSLDLDDNLDLDNLGDLKADLDDDFNFDIDKEISEEEFDLEMDSTEKLLASDNDDNSIDFLGLDDDAEEFSVSDGKLDFNTAENGLDIANLNLDLDATDIEKIMPQDNAYKKQVTNIVEDASENVESLDLDEENLLADFDDNLSFLDLDDDPDVIEETQIDTKLDLARAYIDMGDIDGARSTLEEVLLEGSDEQKKEAKDLLHQTG